jgi:hypothetical protein
MSTANRVLAALLTSASLAAGVASAETIEGVLEVGQVHSALFVASSGSGDLIGQAFRNRSPVGAKILANCLPLMFCKILQGSTRELQDVSPLKFKDEPLGWREITSVQSATMETVVFGYDKSTRTRFGALAIREQDNRLTLRGTLVAPEIVDTDALSIVAKYEIGSTDVVLLQETGGTACPALFRFVTISKQGMRSTEAFGSCSDVIYPRFNEAKITVSMTGCAGPFEPDREKQQARRTRHDYVYSGGVVKLQNKVTQ